MVDEVLCQLLQTLKWPCQLEMCATDVPLLYPALCASELSVTEMRINMVLQAPSHPPSESAWEGNEGCAGNMSNSDCCFSRAGAAGSFLNSRYGYIADFKAC